MVNICGHQIIHHLMNSISWNFLTTFYLTLGITWRKTWNCIWFNSRVQFLKISLDCGDTAKTKKFHQNLMLKRKFLFGGICKCPLSDFERRSRDKDSNRPYQCWLLKKKSIKYMCLLKDFESIWDLDFLSLIWLMLLTQLPTAS